MKEALEKTLLLAEIYDYLSTTAALSYPKAALS